MSLLFVMIGGFLGTICRFSVGEWLYTENGFPLATLSVNLIGCFILGWFLTFVNRRKTINPAYTFIFGTGFIGSFTTFSTFSVETIHLFQKGLYVTALVYVLSTMILGLLLTFLGSKVALLNRKRGDTV
jgi:CrcB protein